MKRLILAFIFLATVAHAQTKELQKTTTWYNKAKAAGDVAKLTLFFSQMPKGGDLHHHYSGAVYLETYLDWMRDQHTGINCLTFRPQPLTDTLSITVDSLRKNNFLYRTLMSLWSTQDFADHYHNEVEPDAHFFNTFGYFGSVSGNFRAGLAEIKNRAAGEHVQYIETMLSSVSVPLTSTTYNDRLYAHLQSRDENGLFPLFTELKNSLDETLIGQAVDKYNAKLNDARKGIDDETFCMRYQAYAVRSGTPSAVFISLYAAFRVCVANDAMVGVNFVGPENGIVAMSDYWLHMQMFRYFHSLPEFKDVHIALHAGELSPGMVKPEDMGYHIHDALTIAGAERIGHGVDLPYERNAIDILHHMADKKKAIEINLTSNEFILGIKNERHPLHLYYDAGVPMVISTDDAGVSRSTLTDQYGLLASRYTFTYPQIKQLVFNSIAYSFLTPAEKARNKALLEKSFTAFEKKMAAME